MIISSIELNSDLKRVEEVAKKAFQNGSDSSLAEWFSFAEMKKMIGEERGICLKAEDDKGNMLGMIYAQQESPVNGKEGLEKWVIVIAGVHNSYSGQGIGSELLKAIEKEALTRGAKKLFVYTNKDDEKVIHFYQKNGYEDAGWIRDYQYGENNSAAFLLKYLK